MYKRLAFTTSIAVCYLQGEPGQPGAFGLPGPAGPKVSFPFLLYMCRHCGFFTDPLYMWIAFWF